MKGICLTIAALFMMSATVSAKGEPTTQRGAPTHYADAKVPSLIKVTYDDAAAQDKAQEEPLYIKKAEQETIYLAEVNERKIYIDYYTHMGDDSNGAKLNLNYGGNTMLAPLQGNIR